jgi:protein TonB
VSSRGAIAPIFIACSIALHGGALALIGQGQNRMDPNSAASTELVVFEVATPKAAEQPEPVKLPPVAPKPRPAKVIALKKPSQKDVRPPPNDEPPPDAPKQVPLVVGMTMSSTTTGGAFAAPVGNTLYGKTEPRAPSPESAKPYAGPRLVPSDELDSQPTLLSDIRIPYPQAAWRELIEGTVYLSVVIDEQGKVASARVLSGPGHGLDEAAKEAIVRFRFKPATKAGEPVPTQINYKYTFVLN